jgi:hypothetical protein
VAAADVISVLWRRGAQRHACKYILPVPMLSYILYKRIGHIHHFCRWPGSYFGDSPTHNIMAAEESPEPAIRKDEDFSQRRRIKTVPNLLGYTPESVYRYDFVALSCRCELLHKLLFKPWPPKGIGRGYITTKDLFSLPPPVTYRLIAGDEEIVFGFCSGWPS